jgi:hypothetical protein
VRKEGARVREALVEAIEDELWRPSHLKMRRDGSPTLAIGLRINPYECRCENFGHAEEDRGAIPRSSKKQTDLL